MKKGFRRLTGNPWYYWSGRRDSNSRSLAPHKGAAPFQAISPHTNNPPNALPLGDFGNIGRFMLLHVVSRERIILFGICLGQIWRLQYTRGSKMSALTELEMRALTTKDVGRPLMDGEGLVGKVRQTRDGLTVYFEYRYRGTEGRQRAISCGAWPKLSLKKIRLARDAYRSKVGDGKDPLAEKEANKLTAHADQVEAVARDMARLDAVAAAAQRMTAIDLFDRWEKSALKARKDGGAEVRRMFEKDVLPELGAMAVEDIKKRHIAAMLDKIKERGVGRMVNLLLSLTRQMFRFAVSRDWIEADPTAALRKADFGGKEVERERVLSESEIKELRDKMPGGRFAPTTEAAIWIMLSTCCRVGELSKAEWCDLDIDGRRWRIPPGNAKNGRENVVTLSDFAAKHFEALRTLQTSRRWIFADRTGDQHIDDKTIAKQVRDRQRSAPMKGRRSWANSE